MFGPVIGGEKVDLVPPRKPEMENFVKWFQDREVTRLLGVLFPTDIKDEEEWYETLRTSKENIVWFICLKDGKHIGSTGVHQINWINQSGISGIVIGEKEQWGKGFATEAIKMQTRFDFESLNLNSVHTHIAVDNIGSIRAAEKAGYTWTGVMKHYFYRQGRFHDVKVGSILRRDWEQVHKE
ncbi:MAG: GNAT family protein [bacterium]|nr:GNAT family protein [bacterium]